MVLFKRGALQTEQIFKELATADVLLVGSPVLVEKCCQAGLQPHLVYHYFDETVLEKLSLLDLPFCDFTFAGSSGYGYGVLHEPRYRLLLELLEKTPLEVWIDEGGQQKFHSPYQWTRKESRKLIKRILQSIPHPVLDRLAAWPSPIQKTMAKVAKEKRHGCDAIPLTDQYPGKCHPGVFGLDMYKLLARSKLTLNKHSAPAAGTVDNIRLFQATGVSACLLMDFGSNIQQLFDADSEVITYHSTGECIEKVEYLLSHDRVKQSIVQTGQRRMLKEHSTHQRCRQIDVILQNTLNR